MAKIVSAIAVTNHNSVTEYLFVKYPNKSNPPADPNVLIELIIEFEVDLLSLGM